MPASKITLPGITNRTLIIGRTGSGKSYFAVWLLSMQNFDTMPWIIVDFKDEDTDLINQIERVQYMGLGDPLPQQAGLYIVKPTAAEIVDGRLEEFFQKIFEHGSIGLFVDEVFPIGQHNKAFNTILMQGRSRRIPVIACTQRPTNISVYCFSEASYVFVFDVTKTGDRKVIAAELPISRNYELPEYHSYYYNVADKYLDKLGPAPDAGIMLDKIDSKIPVFRRTI